MLLKIWSGLLVRSCACIEFYITMTLTCNVICAKQSVIIVMLWPMYVSTLHMYFNCRVTGMEVTVDPDGNRAVVTIPGFSFHDFDRTGDFYTPVIDGTYYGIASGRRAGGRRLIF
jgi:hypothetical protein